MHFAEILRRRKMTRSYTGEPVPREVVARIVERARKAPTAGFSQGLRFVVVTEEDARRAVARAGTEIDWPVPWWYADAGKAIMLLLLGAIDEGLAAGMFGFIDAETCRRSLGIPDDVTPVAAVTIGHPGPDDPGGSRRKVTPPAASSLHRLVPSSAASLPALPSAAKFAWKPLVEVVRWERWR